MSCPASACLAPPASAWIGTCAWIVTTPTTLFGCAESCAAGGGVPACPNSTAENMWLAECVANQPGTSSAWLGVYQDPAVNSPTDGWDRCMAGGRIGFGEWSGGNFPPPSSPRGETVSRVSEETRISWSSPVAPPSTAMQLLEQQHAAGGCHVEYEAEDENV